uniref:Uncharacterized protein n=1 Tax=mine drainage metagenome TaxID=410659 RepID=E6PST3_9ZZZZ
MFAQNQLERSRQSSILNAAKYRKIPNYLTLGFDGASTVASVVHNNRNFLSHPENQSDKS